MPRMGAFEVSVNGVVRTPVIDFKYLSVPHFIQRIFIRRFIRYKEQNLINFFSFSLCFRNAYRVCGHIMMPSVNDAPKLVMLSNQIQTAISQIIKLQGRWRHSLEKRNQLLKLSYRHICNHKKVHLQKKLALLHKLKKRNKMSSRHKLKLHRKSRRSLRRSQSRNWNKMSQR